MTETLVKCYECNRKVPVSRAKLIKFGFDEAFELAEESEESIIDYLEELGDFYVCQSCNERLLTQVVQVMHELEAG